MSTRGAAGQHPADHQHGPRDEERRIRTRHRHTHYQVVIRRAALVQYPGKAVRHVPEP